MRWREIVLECAESLSARGQYESRGNMRAVYNYFLVLTEADLNLKRLESVFLAVSLFALM